MRHLLSYRCQLSPSSFTVESASSAFEVRNGTLMFLTTDVRAPRSLTDKSIKKRRFYIALFPSARISGVRAAPKSLSLVVQFTRATGPLN